MARNIFIVNATHVVTSDSHPEGVYSTVAGYPVQYDSRNYEATEQNPNGNEELALIVARADYADRVKQLSIAHNRVKWTVTLEDSNGRTIDRKAYGAFPDMTPVEPEPEPEEPEEPENGGES